MKRSVALSLLGILLFVGCTSQPQIQIEDTDETNQTTEQNLTAETNQTQVIVDSNIDENQLQNSTVQVETLSGDNVTIKEEKHEKNAAALVKEVVYFDFDRYDVKKEMLKKLENVAKAVTEYEGSYTLRIEGNCDEWGSDEYNYALGLKRGQSVKSALIALGVESEKMTLISYGESNPVCADHTKACWEKNRRVNFTLLP